jgi:restriction system protein
VSIPPFQETMYPLLKTISNGNEFGAKFVIESVSDAFKLSDEERKQLLPSGSQRIIANRCLWALSYMKKAGLIESPKRGVYKITKRGTDALSSGITNIGIDFLSRYPEFQEFRTRKNEQQNDGETEEIQPIQITEKTPEEILENAYQGIRRSLESDILDKVYSQSPEFFERLVIELLVKMGYGGSIFEAGKAIGKSGDEGIDGVIKEDKLGLDIIYIQAKRWAFDNVVGRPEIQKFVGALAGQGAKKGIFITTSRFTKEALDYSPRNETKVVLVDGKKLAQLLIDYDIGVSPVSRYEIKRIDNDYFGDE